MFLSIKGGSIGIMDFESFQVNPNHIVKVTKAKENQVTYTARGKTFFINLVNEGDRDIQIIYENNKDVYDWLWSQNIMDVNK
jgi:hypothetical protein